MKKTTLPPRAELNLHTAASLYDGVISREEVISTASSEEYSAVAVTDLNSVQMFPRIYCAAKEKGIAHKIIYGAEIKCRCEGKELLLTLLAKNQAGCKNLYRIISQEEPQLDFVKTYRDGLLIGFTSDNPADAAVPEICDYIELRPTTDKQGIRQKLLTAEKLNIPAVAVSGARYLEQDDAICRDVLWVYAEQGDEYIKHELYLRSGSEMLEQLAFLGEDKAYELVIENPNKIAEQIEQIAPVREEIHLFHLPNAEEELRELTYKFAKEKYGETLPETVQKHLDKEFSLILEQDCASRFLLFYKIVGHLQKELPPASFKGDWRTGETLTACLLGINNVNPLPPHYLCSHCKQSEFVTDGSVFSGFDLPDKSCPKCGKKMTADGQDIPWEMLIGDDKLYVSLSVTSEARKKAADYLLSLFGTDRIVRVGTLLREYDKVYVRELVKRFSEKHDIEITQTQQARIMKKLDAHKVEVGGNVEWFYIIPEDMEIYDFFPVRAEYDETITALFDFGQTNGTLYMIELSDLHYHPELDLMERYTGTSFKDVPLNEPELYELFNGEGMPAATSLNPDNTIPATLGLLERSRDVDELLSLKPKNFSQLAKIVGMRMRSIPDSSRINGVFLVKSGLLRFEELIAFGEDVFRKLVSHGMDSKEASALMRKVVRYELKQDEAAQEKMLKCGISRMYIEYCKTFLGLYPKTSSIEKTMRLLHMAWYKLHYPAAFYAATLNVQSNKFDLTILAQDRKKALKELDELSFILDAYSGIDYPVQLCRECLMRGVRFLPPDPEKSDKELLTPENGNIRLPLEKWRQVKSEFIYRKSSQ